MTADFNQSPSDLPELPESIKHLGEGPSGDAFRELYAEMVKEFTPEEISQIIGSDNRSAEARALANWKTILEDSGWTVLASSVPGSESFPLDRLSMTAVIPTLAHYLHAADRLVSPDEDFVISVQRPTELSDFEKLQAAARPTRYSGLPDDLILLRPDAKTIDHRLKDLLGLRLSRGDQAGSKSSEDAVGSDQLAAFEHLRTDEEAAAHLKRNRKAKPHTPTATQFRAEYAALLSRLEFLEGRRGGTTGQSTQRWLAEYDRMVAAQAAAASETAQQADDAVPVPSELWHAVRGVLGIPGLREALVNLAEKDGYRSDWYAEDLDSALEDLSTFEAEQSKEKSEATLRALRLDPAGIGAGLKRFLEDRVKPSADVVAETAKAKGTRIHEELEKFYLDQLRGRSGSQLLGTILGKSDLGKSRESEAKTPEATESTSSFSSKLDSQLNGVFVDYLRLIEPTEESMEPRTGRDLSADFSLQDLIADYDESRLPGAAGYITLEGNRFPGLYAQLVELFTTEGFSDRDRLVGLLGLLDGYEASDDYSTGDAYHISRIRQLLKRQR